MNRRMTIYDLQSQKGRQKWLQVHVDNAAEAAAVEAGITILSCEPDHTSMRLGQPCRPPSCRSACLMAPSQDGDVYHSYSAYERGLDVTWGMYQWLDRAPAGAQRGWRDRLIAASRFLRERDGVMLAQVAGVVIEETVSTVVMSCAGTVVAIRVSLGRWFPRR